MEHRFKKDDLVILAASALHAAWLYRIIHIPEGYQSRSLVNLEPLFTYFPRHSYCDIVEARYLTLLTPSTLLDYIELREEAIKALPATRS